MNTGRMLLCSLLAGVAVGLPASSAIAGDGTLVVLNKGQATVSLFDCETNEELAVLGTGIGPHEAATSPDGKTVVVCDYGAQIPGRSLTVINLEAKAVVAKIDLGEAYRPHGIMFFPDGKRVAVTGEMQQSLLVVNIESGAIEQNIPTGQPGSHMVAITPDARRAFVANIPAGNMTAVDLEAGEVIKTITTGDGAEGIDVTPDGRHVWVSNRAADTVSVIDAESLEIVKTIPTASFPIRVKITPDGERALVSCAFAAEVQVFDAESFAMVKSIPMTATAADDQAGRVFNQQGAVPIGILIPPAGDIAYIANTNADLVTMIDLETLEVSGRIDARQEPDGMAWSPLELD